MRELDFLLFHEAEKKKDTGGTLLFNSLVNAQGDVNEQARKFVSVSRSTQEIFDFGDEDWLVTTHSHPEPTLGLEISAGVNLTPIHQTTLSGEGSPPGRVFSLIEQTRAAVTTQVNAALTLMHWHVEWVIDMEIPCEARADYAKKIVASLEP